MSLLSIRKGKTEAEDRILVIGTEGVGKSTFAAGARNPVFIGAEDGLRNLDVARFPQPLTFRDVLAAVDELESGEHDYKTCVIDTADWVGFLIVDEVCRRNDWKQEDFDAYGRGFKAWIADWRRLLSGLDRLRSKRGMEIILLAHSSIETFKNPAGDDFQRYQAKIGGKEAPALLKEWADMVLFAAHEEFTTDKNKGRVKGVSTGQRILHTERTAAWDAKNRHNLPPTIPLDYAEFDAARRAGLSGDGAELLAGCNEIIAKLGGIPESKIHGYIEANRNNPANLARALNTLRAKLAETEGK